MPNQREPLRGPRSASEASSGTGVRAIPTQLAVEIPGALSVSDESVPASGGIGPIVIEALAVPWDTPVEANEFGDTIEFAPGSLAWFAPSRVKFLLDHTNHAFGYGLDFHDAEQGLVATMAVPRDELDDPATARAVQQMRNGVRDAVSVGVELADVETTETDDRYHHRVTSGRLLELSSCVLPRYDDARISTIAAQRPPIGATAMTATIDRRFAAGGDQDDPGEEADEPTEDENEDDKETESSRVEAHRRTVAYGTSGRRTPARDKFGSLGEFAIACARGQVSLEERNRLGFALTDLKTDGIPGLIPAAWVSGYADVLSASRPIIEAFSTIALPDVGMSMEWPVRTRTGPLTGVQATQKTEIESGTIGVTTAPSPVVTWAGGNDVAIQAIERSQPSLATLLLEELTYDLAYVADAQVAADIAAKAAGGSVTITDAAGINEALASAAAGVFGARFGAVPNRLILGLNAWEFFAGAADAEGRPLFPNLNGANPVGMLSFTDLSGQARGMQVICSPDIDPATGLVAWDRAVTTALGPVRTMTADQPAVLGRDVAIYQYGSWMVRRPEAIVKLIPPAPLPLADDTSSSSSSRSSTKK
jgi:phage head maturation protease